MLEDLEPHRLIRCVRSRAESRYTPAKSCTRGSVIWTCPGSSEGYDVGSGYHQTLGDLRKIQVGLPNR